MVTESSLSKQKLIDYLNVYYDIGIFSLTPFGQGSDVDASTYKAQAHNHASYFIKVKRNFNHDISIAIIDFLQSVNIQHIMTPLKAADGQAINYFDKLAIMVFPFIEGESGINRDLTDKHWYALGKVMRQIHEVEVPLTIQSTIPHETFSPKWRRVLNSLLPLINTKPIVDDAALHLLNFIKTNIDTIHTLLNQAEQLSKVIQDKPSRSVLCHSDIHAGNILLQKNDDFYIVDWDSPILAPKERDLMFIGGGVANMWNKPYEETLFYRGYGKKNVSLEHLAFYRHERIIEDIAVYCQKLLLSEEGGLQREKWYREFIDQFAPQGVIDIAIKTFKALK